MTHIPIAIAIQIAIAMLSSWWAGAAAAAFFYLGREIAQAEYRVIETYYGGKRANMPWYGPFECRAWTIKSLLDWIVPTTIVSFIAYLTQYS